MFRKGWHVVPVNPDLENGKGKKPWIDDYWEKSSDSKDQIARWKKQYPRCNWALDLEKSGIVVVDIEKSGLETWNKIVSEHSDPQTYRVMSGGGGVHYYFKAKANFRYRTKLAEHIEIRHRKRLINIPPSRTKKLYIAVDEKQKIAEMPMWLEEMSERVLATKKKSRRYKYTYLKAICGELKKAIFGYEDWVRIGAALHDYFKGSDKGYKLYEDISMGENYQEGDEYLVSQKWESFNSDERGDERVTIATLIKLAGDLGCQMPNPAEGEVEKVFDNVEKELGVKQTWAIETNGKKTTRDANFLISFLNSKGYFTLRNGQIGHAYVGEDGQPKIDLLTERQFHVATAFYQLKVVDKEAGTVKFKKASDVWKESSYRKMYDDIVFTPNKKDDNNLNMWGSLKVEPKWGDTKDIQYYFDEILCNGRKELSQYVLKYLAHIVQKPWEQTPISLVFIGSEGTGKGLLTKGFMGGILGGYQYNLQNREMLKARFKKPLAFRFLTVLNESTWKGDHELIASLKRLTGGDPLEIEEKFGGFYSIDNYSRYLITANNKDAIAVGITNRRFLVIENSTKFDNHPIFKKLWDGINSGELVNVFLDWLMSMDISDFKPFVFPKHLDKGNDETKFHSLDIVGKFWFDVLFTQPRPIITEKGIDRSLVLQAFQQYLVETKSYSKEIGATAFWLKTKIYFGGILKYGTSKLGNNFIQTLHDDIEVLAEKFKITTRIDDAKIFKREQYEVRNNSNF